MQPTARLVEVGLPFNGEEEMKRAIILVLSAVFSLLLLVGCTATEESAPVGATVRLVALDGEFIDMYENPGVTVISNWPPNHECEVVSGPTTVEDVAYWKLECVESAGYIWVRWVDVTNIEVLD